jgi:hypothetical protein
MIRHAGNLLRDPDRFHYLSTKWNQYYRNVLKVRLFRLSLRTRLPLPVTLEALDYVNPQIGDRYRPRPFAGEIHVFRALARGEHDPRDYSLGWHGLAKAINVIEVEGSHVSMVLEPNVHSLGQTIGASLDQVEEEFSAQAASPTPHLAAEPQAIA